MTVTIVSSREFNQDVSRIKRVANDGPVIITDRGRPAHVLLSIEEYRKLTEPQVDIVELLAMPEGEEIDFQPVHVGDRGLYRPADLS